MRHLACHFALRVLEKAETELLSFFKLWVKDLTYWAL